MGGTRFDLLEVIDLEDRYRARVEVADGDLVVIASSHHAAPATWFGWSPTRRLVRSGPSGADRALVDVIYREGVEDRFGSVVIGSGDRIFATPAAWLQARGLDVSVVARRPRSISKQLAFAVRDVSYLEPEDDVRAGEVRLAA